MIELPPLDASVIHADTVEASAPRTLSTDTLFWAEGLDADPRDGTLYVTSIRHRNVYVARRDGTLRPLFTPGRTGIAAAMGVAVDTAQGVVWVATAGLRHMAGYTAADTARAELVQVNAADGTVRSRWTLGDGTGIPGEIALAPDGTVLVSDGIKGVLYRLAPGAAELRVTRSQALRSPQGIAVSADGDVAWVADWSRGILRWDLRTDSVTAVTGPAGELLRGVDGLRRSGRDLIGVQNGSAAPRIVRIRLSADGRRLTETVTLDRPAKLEGEPTVGVVIGDRYVYVASSAWPFWTDDGTRRADGRALPRVVLREFPLAR
jgi:sugar lactone lactonase YvrE